MSLVDTLLFMSPVWMFRLVLAALLLRGGYQCAVRWRAARRRTMAARRRRQGDWRKAPGRILRLGYWLDYDPPPDDPAAVDEYAARIRRNVELDARHGGLFIGYEYEWEGVQRRSRNVAAHSGRLWGRPQHLELFYGLRPGDSVDVWVDRGHPQRSCLKRQTPADLERCALLDMAQALWSPLLRALLVAAALAWTFS